MRENSKRGVLAGEEDYAVVEHGVAAATTPKLYGQGNEGVDSQGNEAALTRRRKTSPRWTAIRRRTMSLRRATKKGATFQLCIKPPPPHTGKTITINVEATNTVGVVKSSLWHMVS